MLDFLLKVMLAHINGLYHVSFVCLRRLVNCALLRVLKYHNSLLIIKQKQAI